MEDIILTGNDIHGIKGLKSHMYSIFSIKDLGRLNYFLGIEVTYAKGGIILSQQRFTSALLRDSGINSFKTAATPLPINLNLQSS